MNRIAPCLTLIGLMPCAGWMTASAEVSRTELGPAANTIIMGLTTDGPDPFGIWLDSGRFASNLVLNASGHDRGDGPPDVAYKENGWPVVVWAYKAGVDFDIAFSEWDGTAWTPTEFLTSNTANQVDPRLFVGADGALHVVWWVGAVEEIYLVTRAAGSSVWGTPVNVTHAIDAEHGRRPAVIEASGTLHVTYERDTPEGSPGIGQDVMVATYDGGSNFTTDLLGGSARTGPLDPVIHTENGRVWVDWAHNDDEFVSAKREGLLWMSHPKKQWTDPSWVGIEDTRRVIRNEILAE